MELVLALLVALPQSDEDKKKAAAEADKALEQFKADLKKAKEVQDFVSAIEKLGETRHPKILGELKTWLTKVPSSEVRSAAALQLSKYERDKEAAEALLAAVGAQKDPAVAVKCVQYAGDTKVKAIAPKLVALYKHKDIDLAREAIDSSGKIKSKDTIEPLIAVVKDLEAVSESGGQGQPQIGPQQEDERVKRKKSLLPAALSALKEITGEKWTTGKEWEIWWKKNKGTWKEPG